MSDVDIRATPGFADLRLTAGNWHPGGALLAAAQPDPAGQLAAQSAARALLTPRLQLLSLTDRRADQSGLLDLLTLLALGLTVLIAVIGVGTAAALSVVERGQEAGLLRALGLGRGALARATLGESVVHGLLGGLLGALLGVPYGWLGVQSLGAGAPFDQRRHCPSRASRCSDCPCAHRNGGNGIAR